MSQPGASEVEQHRQPQETIEGSRAGQVVVIERGRSSGVRLDQLMKCTLDDVPHAMMSTGALQRWNIPTLLRLVETACIFRVK